MRASSAGGVITGAFALAAASPLFAPQLLAFPYRAQTAIGPVWSEVPIDQPALSRIAAHTSVLVQASPLALPDERRPVFLTTGGWRWRWLANTSGGAFALTHPMSPAIVVNQANISRDAVTNGRAIGGQRTLHGVLAHEFTHGMMRRRFGVLRMALAPEWLVEGYADFVARESSLSPREVRELAAHGGDHPALTYYHGRRRVQSLLAANGGNVGQLFE